LLAVAAPTVASDSAEEFARDAIVSFPSASQDEIISWFDPATLPPNPEEPIEQLRQLIDVGPSAQVRRIDWRYSHSMTKSERLNSFVFHVTGETGSVLVSAAVRTTEQGNQLTQFVAQPAPANLTQMSDFTLRDLTIVHLAIAAFALLVVAFEIFAAVACARSTLKKKWLWIPLCFVGVGQITVQLVPESISAFPVTVKLLAVVLFGVGFGKMPIYAPWAVSVALPLGAAYVLWRVHQAPDYPDDDIEFMEVDELDIPDGTEPPFGRDGTSCSIWSPGGGGLRHPALATQVTAMQSVVPNSSHQRTRATLDYNVKSKGSEARAAELRR
jgi:hypothetical protein